MAFIKMQECFKIRTSETIYYQGQWVQGNNPVLAVSTYGGEESCIRGFGGETRGKEATWKTQE